MPSPSAFAYFAPPSSASDRDSQEAVTAGKGTSVNFNPRRSLELLRMFSRRAQVNKTMYPTPVIGPVYYPVSVVINDVSGRRSPVKVVTSERWMCENRPPPRLCASDRLVKSYDVVPRNSDRLKFHPASLAVSNVVFCLSVLPKGGTQQTVSLKGYVT